MKTTEPLLEFSNGTTPREAEPLATAAKTSSIEVSGRRTNLGSVKESKAAWWVYDATGPRYATKTSSSIGEVGD